jgi:hypothetical protein
MKKILLASLTIFAAVTYLTSAKTGEVSSEFLRLAKIKTIIFKATSENDNKRIEPLIQQSGHNFRLAEWRDQWTKAQDHDYTIYRGGAAKSAEEFSMFVIVWSNTQGKIVFSEIGYNKNGSYPSGLTSSP